MARLGVEGAPFGAAIEARLEGAREGDAGLESEAGRGSRGGGAGSDGLESPIRPSNLLADRTHKARLGCWLAVTRLS